MPKQMYHVNLNVPMVPWWKIDIFGIFGFGAQGVNLESNFVKVDKNIQVA